jgi:fibronectin type 3 domain-containing protein
MRECGAPVAKLPFQKPAETKKPGANVQASYVGEVPATMQSANPTASAFYAVNVLNSYGKSAGLSNQVQLPLAPTLPPPSNFREQLTAEGVRLSWDPVSPPTISGIRFAYRVYRREQGSNKDAVAGEVQVGSQPTLLDQSFEWEKTYDYRATVVTVVSLETRAPQNRGEQQVDGEDTPAVSVVTHDVFSPATPLGLQAVFSGPGQKPFIDLVWAPNTEPDLAGYNVYRHEPGTQPVKINSESVKAPAFRDAGVLPGNQYFYSVSAIDVRGNESLRSEEATESVPTE